MITVSMAFGEGLGIILTNCKNINETDYNLRLTTIFAFFLNQNEFKAVS